MKETCDSPWPLLTVLPFVNNIWLSSSCSSDLSSANLLLLFFTMDATSDSERRSVVTSRNFSAPSLIWKAGEFTVRLAQILYILIHFFRLILFFVCRSAYFLNGSNHHFVECILTLSSFRISRRIASLISSRRFGSALSGKLSVKPYLWLNSYKTGCFI